MGYTGLRTSEETDKDDRASDPLENAAFWFPCSGCDRIITGLVFRTAERDLGNISLSRCCLNCEYSKLGSNVTHGPGDWCAGLPGKLFHSIELPPEPGEEGLNQEPLLAHYFLKEPDWEQVTSPAPALLWLHGNGTYQWPETIHGDVLSCLNGPEASCFIVVAPLASCGEPLARVAEEIGYQPGLMQRFDEPVHLPESFHTERTWQCFIRVLRCLGPGKVDFTRLCVSGFSMGGSAAWDLACYHGDQLAAVAPLAAESPASSNWRWPQLPTAELVANLQDLPLRSYSGSQDGWDREGYHAKRMFRWLAQACSHDLEPHADRHAYQCEDRTGEVCTFQWGGTKQLTLIESEATEGFHNCWSFVCNEEVIFGLFSWMLDQRNPYGAGLEDEIEGRQVAEDDAWTYPEEDVDDNRRPLEDRAQAEEGDAWRYPEEDVDDHNGHGEDSGEIDAEVADFIVQSSEAFGGRLRFALQQSHSCVWQGSDFGPACRSSLVAAQESARTATSDSPVEALDPLSFTVHGDLPILVTASHALPLRRLTEGGHEVTPVEWLTAEVAYMLAQELGGACLQWSAVECQRSELLVTCALASGTPASERSAALEALNPDPVVSSNASAGSAWMLAMHEACQAWSELEEEGKVGLHLDIRGTLKDEDTKVIGSDARASDAADLVVRIAATQPLLDLGHLEAQFLNVLVNLFQRRKDTGSSPLPRVLFVQDEHEGATWCGEARLAGFEILMQLEMSEALRSALEEDGVVAIIRIAAILRTFWEEETSLVKVAR